jgi:hypothetical protein
MTKPAGYIGDKEVKSEKVQEIREADSRSKKVLEIMTRSKL